MQDTRDVLALAITDWSKATATLRLESAHRCNVWFECPYCGIETCIEDEEESRLKSVYYGVNFHKNYTGDCDIKSVSRVSGDFKDGYVGHDGNPNPNHNPNPKLNGKGYDSDSSNSDSDAKNSNKEDDTWTIIPNPNPNPSSSISYSQHNYNSYSKTRDRSEEHENQIKSDNSNSNFNPNNTRDKEERESRRENISSNESRNIELKDPLNYSGEEFKDGSRMGLGLSQDLNSLCCYCPSCLKYSHAINLFLCGMIK
jgi:hypothetical protein